MPISIGAPETGALPLELPRIEQPQTNAAGRSFSEELGSAVLEVDKMAKTSQRLQDDFANGRQNDLHGTMIAMSEADVSIRLIAQVRNKCIDAYREIMRMGA